MPCRNNSRECVVNGAGCYLFHSATPCLLSHKGDAKEIHSPNRIQLTCPFGVQGQAFLALGTCVVFCTVENIGRDMIGMRL